jgi:TPR repeat protein
MGRFLALAVLVACSHPPPPPPPPAPRPPGPGPKLLQPDPYSDEVKQARIACDGGDTWSCLRIAVALEHADGAPLDLHAAAGYYQRACDGDIPEACALLSHLYLGHREGFPRDAAKAQALRQRVCDMGHETYCPQPPPPEEEPTD